MLGKTTKAFGTKSSMTWCRCLFSPVCGDYILPQHGGTTGTDHTQKKPHNSHTQLRENFSTQKRCEELNQNKGHCKSWSLKGSISLRVSSWKETKTLPVLLFGFAGCGAHKCPLTCTWTAVYTHTHLPENTQWTPSSGLGGSPGFQTDRKQILVVWILMEIFFIRNNPLRWSCLQGGPQQQW